MRLATQSLTEKVNAAIDKRIAGLEMLFDVAELSDMQAIYGSLKLDVRDAAAITIESVLEVSRDRS